jgi:hypothetical protein
MCILNMPVLYMQLHTWNAQYAKEYQICNICKNIQLYAIYAKNIHICKISMYVSIQGEAKSAALDRTHHLLGMQPEEDERPGQELQEGVCWAAPPLQRADGAASGHSDAWGRLGSRLDSEGPIRGGHWRPWASESSESPPPGPLDRPWASRGHASGSSKRPTVTVSGAAGFRPTGPADRDWLASPRV